MQITKRNPAKQGFSALAALATLAAACPAFAVQPDAAIEQVGLRSSAGDWLVDQIGVNAPTTGYLAQLDAPAATTDASFQAYSGPRHLAQIAVADQVSGRESAYGAPIELAFLGYGLDLGSFVGNGQGASFASDDFGNSQRHAWNGAENLQASLQRGTDNRSVQDQTGFRNASLIVQDGHANFAEVIQSANYNVASILQVGSQNSTSIFQASGFNFAQVSQSGVGNIVAIRQ